MGYTLLSMQEPKQLLVIDDEPKITGPLAAWFASKGFVVATASTVHEALAQIQRIPADVVLLDLRLPDGSGLELLPSLKTHLPDARVVVITGLSDPHTVQQAMAGGASDYVTKPFDFMRCFYAAMGIEVVDLKALPPAPELLERVPEAIARRYRVVPVRSGTSGIVLAMADPLDAPSLDELRRALRCAVVPCAATGLTVMEAVERWYGGEAPKDQHVDALGERADELLDELLNDALRQRASLVELGVGPEGGWVRYRVDGQIVPVTGDAGLSAHHATLIERLKRLACVDPGAGIPQRGRVWRVVGSTTVEIQVSVVPTPDGEGVVVRFNDPSRRLGLDALGLQEEQRRQLEGMLTRPSGLVLVAGPGRSGKTTTLYAALAYVSRLPRALLTLEEQVEQQLPGAIQVELPPSRRLTLEVGLRIIADYEPDAVMIGELADQEHAVLAIRAALAGCLVLSAIPTVDAASAIVRLLDFGLEPAILCSALSGIAAQRLVRKICPSCKTAARLDAAQLTAVGATMPARLGPVQVWQGKGCLSCRGTGCAGRLGIFEVLPVGHHIRSLILKRTPAPQLRQSATSRGLQSLWLSGVQQLQAGATSLPELLATIPPELR